MTVNFCKQFLLMLDLRTSISQFCLSTCLALTALWPAESLASNRVGTIQALFGSATALAAHGEMRELAKGADVYAHDLIETKGGSSAFVVFENGSSVFVRPFSQLQIDEMEDLRDAIQSQEPKELPQNMLISMLKGAFRVVSGKVRGDNTNTLSYRTPVATIGIRGTELEITVAPDTVSSVFVVEGEVDVENPSAPGNTQRVAAGQFTVIRPLRPPTAPRAFNSADIDGDRPGTMTADRVDDPLLEPTESPAEERFLAFPDTDLDMQVNPAYASQGQGASGKLTLLGNAAARSHRIQEGSAVSRERLSGEAIIGQASGLWQVDQGLQLGAFGSASRLEESQRYRLDAPPSTGLATTRRRVAGLVAGTRGKHSLGLSLIYDETAIEERQFESGEIASFSTDNSAKQIVIGSHTLLPDGEILGLSLSTTELSGTSRGTDSKTRLRGRQDSFEALLRSPSTLSPSWGLRLRFEQVDTKEHVNDPEEGVLSEVTDAWSMRTAAGLGWTLSSRSVVSLDFAVAYSREDALQREPAGLLLETQVEERLSSALHLGTQIELNPWLIATAGSSIQFVRDDTFVEAPTEPKRAERSVGYFSGWNAGLGVHKAGWYFGYFAASQSDRITGVTHNFFLVREW